MTEKKTIDMIASQNSGIVTSTDANTVTTRSTQPSRRTAAMIPAAKPSTTATTIATIVIERSTGSRWPMLSRHRDVTEVGHAEVAAQRVRQPRPVLLEEAAVEPPLVVEAVDVRLRRRVTQLLRRRVGGRDVGHDEHDQGADQRHGHDAQRERAPSGAIRTSRSFREPHPLQPRGDDVRAAAR